MKLCCSTGICNFKSISRCQARKDGERYCTLFLRPLLRMGRPSKPLCRAIDVIGCVDDHDRVPIDGGKSDGERRGHRVERGMP